MKRSPRHDVVLLLLPVLVAVANGCGGPAPLMTTPNIYARGYAEPFENVPPELQNNKVDVLYMTDRKPEPDKKTGELKYGVKRSRSVAYGVATVEFGKDVAWADLEAASKTGKRKVELPMTITKTVEL